MLSQSVDDETIDAPTIDQPWALSHVLIYEPEATGHQMNYVRYLLHELDAHVPNIRVTLLTTSEALAHPNSEQLFNEFSHFVTPRIAPEVTRTSVFRLLGHFYLRQWRQAEAFAAGLSNIGVDSVDFIVLPHLESIGMLQIALRPGLFRGRPWATIAIAMRFHLRQCDIETPFNWLDLLQRALYWRVIRSPGLVCFGSVNPYFARVVRHPIVKYCPDPCSEPVLSSVEEARRVYGIRPETCLILVFGFIDRRKCIDVLLNGIARLDPDIDVTVLLAGTQHSGHMAGVLSGDTARHLRESRRLVEVNRFIVEGLDVHPMNAADIAWVFYEPEFVIGSSILIRAGLFRRPVIARRQGVIGRLVEEHQLGATLAGDSPDEVAAAVRTLASDPALRRRMGDNGARAFADNTPENCARPLTAAIQHSLRAREAAVG